MQFASAAWAGLGLKIDHHLIARLGCRQLGEVLLTANRLVAAGLTIFRIGLSAGIARGSTGAHGLLKILDDQLHLLGIQLLGLVAEPVPMKTLDYDVQLIDLGAQSGILKLGISTSSRNAAASSGRFSRSMATPDSAKIGGAASINLKRRAA